MTISRVSSNLRGAALALGVALAANAIAPWSSPARADVLVTTKGGPVRGIVSGAMTSYLGIPYAAPPVGDLRWRPPQAPQPWQAVRDARAFGARCPQTAAIGEFSAPSATEDCLFLNVFVPSASSPAAKRAVMVWIPGGGFFAGGADDYDSSRLVETGDVVVVSFNYRLGVLGSLTQSDLNTEGHAFANYGLLDQQFALQWMRDNIAAFGADPNNVTLFGESAGAISIYGHMASPGSKGLFHKAILESGFTDDPRGPPRSMMSKQSEADQLGSKFASAMGCAQDVAACLRRAPVQQILEKQTPFLTGLIEGAPSLPTPLETMAREGMISAVPMINGTNHDEWRWPLARVELLSGKPLTADRYPDEMAKFFGPIGAKVASEYAPGAFASPSEALAAAETDGLFSCSALRLDHSLSQHAPVYAYEFNDANAPMYMPTVSFPYGAAHTTEIQFLFPLFHGGSGAAHPLSAAQNELSMTMVRYWTNFAKAGDPNGAGLPVWPKFALGSDQIQLLKPPAPATIDSFSADHRCAFWNALSAAAR